MGDKYDSTQDTLTHIGRVQELIGELVVNLCKRREAHDKTKLESPERELFDIYTPKLKDCTYGSNEYKQFLAELKPALDHHYAEYDHHPEHFQNGVDGMSLTSLIEMLCDWKAAGERHADGSMARSMQINRERFGISDQLASILNNTAIELGWL
jgi:hypothetical protein